MRVACQVYGLAVDVLQQETTPYLSGILEDLTMTLIHNAQSVNAESGEGNDEMNVDVEWQVSYHILAVLGKVLCVYPGLTTQPEEINWPAIIDHLLFLHA